jgi:hypothetical protein
MRSTTARILLLILIAGCAGCAGGDQQGAVAGGQGAAEPATSPEPAITVPTPTRRSPRAVATEIRERSGDIADEVRRRALFTMPKLVGRNLQDAQDRLQARGSYLLDEVDATGAARRQILDNRWRVCSQRPAPGRRVPLTTVVRLAAVKLGESCP